MNLAIALGAGYITIYYLIPTLQGQQPQAPNFGNPLSFLDNAYADQEAQNQLYDYLGDPLNVREDFGWDATELFYNEFFGIPQEDIRNLFYKEDLNPIFTDQHQDIQRVFDELFEAMGDDDDDKKKKKKKKDDDKKKSSSKNAGFTDKYLGSSAKGISSSKKKKTVNQTDFARKYLT